MSYLYIADDDSEFGPVWEADQAAKYFSADELAESEPVYQVVSLDGHRDHYLAADYLYEAAAILGENNAQAEEWTAAADTYESHQSLFSDDTCAASPKDGFNELTGMCGACEYIHEVAYEAEGVLDSLGYVTIWNDGVQVFRVGNELSCRHLNGHPSGRLSGHHQGQGWQASVVELHRNESIMDEHRNWWIDELMNDRHRQDDRAELLRLNDMGLTFAQIADVVERAFVTGETVSVAADSVGYKTKD